MGQQYVGRSKDSAECRLCGCLRSTHKVVNGERLCPTSGESLSRAEPPPKDSDGPAIWDLVMKDFLDRDKAGEKKYGKRLRPHDGRDALVDAYQEALDLVVYIRKAIYERDGE